MYSDNSHSRIFDLFYQQVFPYTQDIAFLIQTILFSFAFTLMPFIHSFKMPHEDCMYIINILFLIVENGQSSLT